jgi:hypothetical protein
MRNAATVARIVYTITSKSTAESIGNVVVLPAVLDAQAHTWFARLLTVGGFFTGIAPTLLAARCFLSAAASG